MLPYVNITSYGFASPNVQCTHVKTARGYSNFTFFISFYGDRVEHYYYIFPDFRAQHCNYATLLSVGVAYKEHRLPPVELMLIR